MSGAGAAPVSRRARALEQVAVLLIGAGVLAASQLPALWGWRAQVRGYYPDKVFTGALHTYADDAAIYWSWMSQAAEGRLGLANRFTAEEHPRTHVNLLFWGLGSVSRLTGAGEVAVYTLAKPVLGALLFFLLYLLAARLFPLPGQRVACFVLLAVSSGWEGLLESLKPLGVPHVSSPQWWTPEMNTFFSLLLFPDFVASFAAMIGTLLLLTAAWCEEERPLRARAALAAGAGLVLFVLTFFNPYDAASLVGMVAAAPLVLGWLRRGTLQRDLGLAALSLGVWFPSVVWNAWTMRGNPSMRAWFLQGGMWTPEPRALVVSFGVGLPLALLSALALRRMGRPHIVLGVWLIVILFVIHLPVRFQRRMIGGVQFPLAALAAAALFLVVLPAMARWARGLRPRIPVPRGVGAGALAVVLLLVPVQALTPFYVCRAEWARLRRLEYPAWLPTPVRQGLRYLARRPEAEAVVLAAFRTGNHVPYEAGKRTVLGHHALTLDAQAREEEVARFFSEAGADDAWRLAQLRRWRVRYLLHGPFERALGDFEPSRRPWLRQVWVEGAGGEAETAVYAVEVGLE